MSRHGTAWVDPAKGIGIVLVVVGHVTDGLVRARVPFDGQVFRVLYDTLYSFHMPLFFFLSGLFFVQSLEKRGLAGFVGGKVDSLVYPYILWSLVQGLVEVGMARYTNSGARLSDVLAFPWAPRQQMWFLYALFFVFVVAALARSFLGARWLAILTVAAVAGFMLRGALPAVPVLRYLAIYTVFFLAGVHWRSRSKEGRDPSVVALCLAPLVFVAAQVMLQWGTKEHYVTLLAALVAAFAGIALVVVASRWLAARGSRIFAFLGRHSMAIFLLHTFFAAGSRIVLQKFLHVDSVTVHLLAGIGLGIGGPLLIGLAAARFGWEEGLFTAPRWLQVEHRWIAARGASQSIG